MVFGLVLGAVAVIAGAIAAVTGFGAGSLLTPALAVETGTRLAVAAIAIPHFVGTAQRFWMLRTHVDRRLLLGFGIASAAGGLGGALLGTRISSDALALVFGGLLVLAGISEFTGWMQLRVVPTRLFYWMFGVRGKTSVNVEPTSTVLSSMMSPPIARANCRLIARPSPVPPVVCVSDRLP
jgi:uncharacterized membrane protein YfcA